jgi:hypothetical protein
MAVARHEACPRHAKSETFGLCAQGAKSLDRRCAARAIWNAYRVRGCVDPAGRGLPWPDIQPDVVPEFVRKCFEAARLGVRRAPPTQLSRQEDAQAHQAGHAHDSQNEHGCYP